MSSPPQLFVLPKTASSESQVVSLQNPRLSQQTRYLVCPNTGFYEFTKIAAPSSTPRSWLVDGARAVVKNDDDKGEPAAVTSTSEDFETHILKDGEIFVATPYDPLFLVLPALASDATKKRMFLSTDDHIEKLAETSPHLPQILQQDKTRTLIEARMAAVCDTVEAGDESMYRLNETKLLDEVLSKAQGLSKSGLPKSMEERFVTKPLEAPVLTRRSQAHPGLTTEDSTVEDSQTPATEKSESQASISSVETSDSATTQASVSTAATTPSAELSEEETIAAAMTPSSEVLSLQRHRVAFNFILSAYLAPSLQKVLQSNLAAGSKLDFAPLEEYLRKLAKLKAEVLASRASTDYSRKRGLDDLEDERAEKRRKTEEEEKRKKAGESRGVKQLKKVNVSGMKKMSDFFKKKT
jgi:hypothetical protein